MTQNFEEKNAPKLEFLKDPKLESQKDFQNDHVSNCNFGVFLIFRIGTIGADAKYLERTKSASSK